MPALEANKLIQNPFCGDKDCEGQIKDFTTKSSLAEGEGRVGWAIFHLDGSPPYYHYRPASNASSQRWVLFVNGGAPHR